MGLARSEAGVHQVRTRLARNGPRFVGSWSTPSSGESRLRRGWGSDEPRTPWMGFGRAAGGGAAPAGSYLRLLRKGLAKPPCCHDAGGLLHHRFSFSLTCLRRQRESSFLRRFPSGHPAWPLASFLPCGARTFLMTHVPYGTQAPRSSGPLRGSDSTTVLPRWVETFVCTQPVPRAARNTPQATGVAARRATACAKLARECIQRQQMCARLLVCLPYDTFWA